VLDQGDENPLHRTGLPGIAEQGRDLRVEIERDAHILRVVHGGPVEAVDGDDERYMTFLEVVDRREGVGQPAGVGEDHGTEGTVGKLVPHEPEPVLARRAEQVQQQMLADGDPAEIHRDGGGPLVLDARQVVEAGAHHGEGLLGGQRPDLADRADEGGLAHPEPARDDDLEDGERPGVAVLRGCGGHAAPPPAGRRWAAHRPAVAA
jgi:hypothetical protein